MRGDFLADGSFIEFAGMMPNKEYADRMSNKEKLAKLSNISWLILEASSLIDLGEMLQKSGRSPRTSDENDPSH